MEQKEREERFNQYARDKVVGRLIQNVKEEVAKQEELKKQQSSGHAPEVIYKGRRL